MKIKGESVTGGMAERDAIVTHMPISFTGGVELGKRSGKYGMKGFTPASESNGFSPDLLQSGLRSGCRAIKSRRSRSESEIPSGAVGLPAGLHRRYRQWGFRIGKPANEETYIKLQDYSRPKRLSLNLRSPLQNKLNGIL
jgi:hypothetical protein